MTSEKLKELLQKMRDVTKGGDDAESWHVDADDLLVEAFSLLADGQSEEVRQLAAELIEAYDNIDKWYA